MFPLNILVTTTVVGMCYMYPIYNHKKLGTTLSKKKRRVKLGEMNIRCDPFDESTKGRTVGGGCVHEWLQSAGLQNRQVKEIEGSFVITI